MIRKNNSNFAEALAKEEPLKKIIDPNASTSLRKQKRIILCVEPGIHLQLKKLAVEEETSILTLGREAIKDLLIKYNASVKHIKT